MKTKFIVSAAALVAAACTESTSPDISRSPDAGLAPSAVMASSENFDSGVTAPGSWSTLALTTSPGSAAKAPTTFLGRFADEVVTLSVPAGSTSVTLTFDLYIIGSWDGAGSQGFGADKWQIEVSKGNGPRENVFHTSFSNQATKAQSYPKEVTQKGTRPDGTGSIATNSLGYPKANGKFDRGDTTYRLTFTVANPSGSAMVFYFHTTTSLQGSPDESWGLDNVSLSGN